VADGLVAGVEGRLGERQIVGRLPLQTDVGALPSALELIETVVEASRDEPVHVSARSIGQRRAVVRFHAQEIGLLRELAVRKIDEDSDFADAGVPAIADQSRDIRTDRIGHVAIVGFHGTVELEPLVVVKGHLGAKIDLTSEATLNLVGRGALVDVHRRHELRSDVAPRKAVAAVRTENLSSVQPRGNTGHASDLNAIAFGREVIGVQEARDGHA
jgi:hypothetical protein